MQHLSLICQLASLVQSSWSDRYFAINKMFYVVIGNDVRFNRQAHSQHPFKRKKKMHTSVMLYFFLLPSGLALVAIFRSRLEFHSCTIQSILDVFYMSQGSLPTTKFSLTDLIWFRKFEISTRP